MHASSPGFLMHACTHPQLFLSSCSSQSSSESVHAFSDPVPLKSCFSGSLCGAAGWFMPILSSFCTRLHRPGSAVSEPSYFMMGRGGNEEEKIQWNSWRREQPYIAQTLFPVIWKRTSVHEQVKLCPQPRARVIIPPCGQQYFVNPVKTAALALVSISLQPPGSPGPDVLCFPAAEFLPLSVVMTLDVL